MTGEKLALNTLNQYAETLTATLNLTVATSGTYMITVNGYVYNASAADNTLSITVNGTAIASRTVYGAFSKNIVVRRRYALTAGQVVAVTGLATNTGVNFSTLDITRVG